MKIKILALGAIFVFFSVIIQAQAFEKVFVEKADDMVEQILNSEKKYSKTRRFIIVEEQTRAIKIRAKNNMGEVKTLDVLVPVGGKDSAARLKIEFDLNSDSLRPSAYPLLAELGKAVSDERVANHKVCIKGHTDSDGEDEYNLNLSYDRANSVLHYLQRAFGISGDRLMVFGYGESMPLAANTSPENRQNNRRVEVSLNCPEIK